MRFKNMTISSLLATLLLVPGVVGKPSEPSDSLAVHLQIEKTVFLVGEEATAVVYLVNQTDRVLRVPAGWRSQRHLRLECRDSGRRMVAPSTRVQETILYPEPMGLLPPRDSLLKSEDLAGFFGASIDECGYLCSQTPGVYALRATYDEKYASAEVRYSVVETTSSEKEASGQLRSICERYGSQARVMAVPALEELLRLYPQTAFGPAILRILRNTYQSMTLKNDKKVIGYGKMTVEMFPNSYESAFAIYDIACRLSAPEAIQYFTAVETTRAGTRAARAARQLRIRCERGECNPKDWK